MVEVCMIRHQMKARVIWLPDYICCYPGHFHNTDHHHCNGALPS